MPAIPLSFQTLPALLLGDYRRVYQIAMQHAAQPEQSRIQVEKIRGSIFLVSGEKDQIWPSMEMSQAMVSQLQALKFPYEVQHLVAAGGNHAQPQHNYHAQAIEFLDLYVRPACHNARQQQVSVVGKDD